MASMHRIRRGHRVEPASFRPTVCVLEDRTVPSAYRVFPAPATHLQIVIETAKVQAGQSFGIKVLAEDSGNHVVSGYTGAVHFSLGATDANAVLPADYTFKASDLGVHQFQLTFTTAGAQTIKAAGTSAGTTIAGSIATTVGAAPAATQLLVLAPAHATVGAATNVTVVALDASGHVATTYGGTVNLSAVNASLPAGYAFSSADHGQHTFQVSFLQAATAEGVTATGVLTTGGTTTTINGQTSLSIDAAGQVTHFALRSLGTVVAGAPANFQLVALDANNRIVSSYAGKVHFTITGGDAILPVDYTFIPADAGSHIFAITFNTAGRHQTITVSDGAVSSKKNVAVQTQSWMWGWTGWNNLTGWTTYGWGWW